MREAHSSIHHSKFIIQNCRSPPGLDLHPQRAQLAVQMGALHPHLLGHLADVAGVFVELVLQVGLLELFPCLTQGLIERHRRCDLTAGHRGGRPQGVLDLILGNLLSGPQDQNPLHQVLELPDIAVPGVMAQEILRRHAEVAVGQFFVGGEPIHVVGE